MSRIAWVSIVFLVFPSILAAQGVEELEKRNGFKDIKLVTLVRDYQGLEFKKEITDETFPKAAVYAAKKGAYESIGKLKIFELQVKTYKDSIYQIVVITEKDPSLYKSLKKNFGEPKFDLRNNYYYWSATTLSLTYTSHSKNKIKMVYRSSLMVDKLKKDKKKEIEVMADDF